MTRKRLLSTVSLLILATIVWGQAPVVPGTLDPIPTQHRQDRPVNFGIKGGFTSSLFLLSYFTVNNAPITQIQNNYMIGYFGSLFMRINFDRHFLQPEVSYNINRCSIMFEKQLPDDAPAGTIPQEASITSSIHSIDIPVIYGYNIIKEGPYSLAVFGGPKLRYIWAHPSKITFENFDQENIQEELYPLNISLTAGVAVTISRIFFDFRYDVGLHNITKRIVQFEEEAHTGKISFRRRDNVLSFSLGVFF